jgi:DNA-binding CsgD family transcriptional regulator
MSKSQAIRNKYGEGRQGKTYKQIGAEFGVSPNTVRIALLKAPQPIIVHAIKPRKVYYYDCRVCHRYQPVIPANELCEHIKILLYGQRYWENVDYLIDSDPFVVSSKRADEPEEHEPDVADQLVASDQVDGRQPRFRASASRAIGEKYGQDRQGKTVKEIAQEFGVSLVTVYSGLKQAGVHRSSPRTSNDQTTDVDQSDTTRQAELQTNSQA